MNRARVWGVLPALLAIVGPAWGGEEVPGPPIRPSMSRARASYARACASCHGVQGAPPPTGAPMGVRLPVFSDPDWLAERTPADVFETVRSGHGGRLGAAPTTINLQEAWDLATLVWSFGHSAREVDEGRRLFAVHCADCHGAAGDGIGAALEERPEISADFSLVGTFATDTDDDVMAVLTDGLPEFGMPGFVDTLSDSQRAALVSYLRALPFSEVYLASAAGRSASWRSPRLTGPLPSAPPSRLRRRDEVSFTQWVARIVATLVAGCVLVWVLRGRARS